ncbi:MAG: murein biosynthesis integral membrane protein MurJ [Paracoccaceae bacterium]|nr:murein biosynthesis integral membrane protein MurJ [Paracoccaceae bacterium]
MKPIRLVRGFLTVGAWTLLSRVVGFTRDVLIAAYLGSGPVAQAFLIAFSLPNTFRRFFAEGAFNTAFVPIFSKKLEADENPREFAEDALAGLGATVLLVSILSILAMPALVYAMASGFAGDERFTLAVQFGRITFPYILFMSGAALFSGILNAGGRFIAAAAAPVLLNVFFIAAMLIAHHLHWRMGLTLAWTTPITGAAQMGLVWIAAARMGFPLRLKWPRMTPDLRRLLTVAFPSVMAAGVVQLNLLVGRQVGSFFDGAIAWLSYADRLYQLPLGVVGIAISVVLLPDISRRLKANDTAGGRHAYNRAAEFSLLLTLPAAVALMVIPVPLISVLFQRGAFSQTDTVNTALTLAVYGAGLPAFVLQKVLQPLYFAREDTRRPFRYALYSMVVNAGAAVALAPFIGFIAAALGTTLAGWSMVVQLWLGKAHMGEAALLDDRLKARVPRIALASAVMGAALWALAHALAPQLATPGVRYGALAILVLVGGVVYFGAVIALGGMRVSDLKSSFRRGA